jgi:hypothetical protein
MKTLAALVLFGMVVSFCVNGQTNTTGNAGQTVETLVCVRHGEKPTSGLGQLTCRGLNRALALPKVLLAKFGQPQFVFAPSPTEKIDGIGSYNYVRPLMTIEPTAIRCGLPVNTQFGYQEIKGLENELEKSKYQKATIFIAWEHSLLDEFTKDLVKKHGGDTLQVPAWSGKDFDTIFIIKITHSEGHDAVAFVTDHEGLNDLSDECP